VLLFQKRFLPGLVDGSITLTFRQWPTARVKPGGRYRVHPIGVVEVVNVRPTRVADLQDSDARAAGFADLDELLAYLEPAAKGKFGPDTALFRIQLTYGGDGDWVAISRDDTLGPDDIAEIDAKLSRFDARKAWTRETLALIEENPRTVASKLAARLGRETAPFKADVVKLKKLGLTQSYEIGYELSPRGKAYWKVAKRRK
jgi:hypothetical protein